jgi:hypothetical protein
MNDAWSHGLQYISYNVKTTEIEPFKDVIPTRFAERYKRIPEDRELDSTRVEVRSYISTLALLVVGGDKKGTQRVSGRTGPPCSWGCKYGDLALQVRRVSNLTQ